MYITLETTGHQSEPCFLTETETLKGTRWDETAVETTVIFFLLQKTIFFFIVRSFKADELFFCLFLVIYILNNLVCSVYFLAV